MRPGNPFKIGETVKCECPDGECALPSGLPSGATAKVIATYLSKTYVEFDGKTFLVRNAYIHRLGRFSPDAFVNNAGNEKPEFVKPV